MSDADCTPGREPRSVAAGSNLQRQSKIGKGLTTRFPLTSPYVGRFCCAVYDNSCIQWYIRTYMSSSELSVSFRFRFNILCVFFYLPHAVNCWRFCFQRRQSVFFVCVWNISGTAEQICTKFTRKTFWSLARTSLKVKVKCQNGHQGQKRHFSALSATCVWFMFGKTSLAFSLFLCCLFLLC